MELLTPALQYLSSGACQENLLKTATGFEGICNRCRIVHVKKRRVFLVNTPLGGSCSSHWRLKTLQIIDFSCFGQVHGVKVKIVKFDFILLLERQKLYDSRQNYWKHYNIRESGQRLCMRRGSSICMITHLWRQGSERFYDAVFASKIFVRKA